MENGITHRCKNMVGAFYQPKAVVIDTQTLQTLPPRELAAGLAEVIKYGLICDASFLSWLELHIQALNDLDADVLKEAIVRSCAAKARVVAEDERESGIRAILNFGHTFGHAIETEMGYGNWLHGEAVAVGMVMALYMSQLLGWLSEHDFRRAVALVHKANLPVVPHDEMKVADFLKHMAVDKKALDGKIRLVLLQSLGRASVSADYPFEMLEKALSADYAALTAVCQTGN